MACFQKQEDVKKFALFPVELPSPPIEGATKPLNSKSPYIHVQLGYNKLLDSVGIIINEDTFAFDKETIQNYAFSYTENFYPKHRVIINLKASTDIPYFYVEQLFDWLREIDNRKVFLATHTASDSFPLQIGNALLLPPISIFYDSMAKTVNNNSFTQVHPIPTSPLELFKWKPVFYPNNEKVLHLKIDSTGNIKLDSLKIESQKELLKLLTIHISTAKQNKKELYIFFDVDWQASYKDFLFSFCSIKSAYFFQWDQLSKEQYGQEYSLLLKKERREIRKSTPLQIIGFSQKEYIFFKKLADNHKLDFFIKTHFKVSNLILKSK